MARGFRWLKQQVLAISAIRDISDAVLFSKFAPAEQFGHEMLGGCDPARADWSALFLEPAGLKDDYRIPYLWQTTFPGIDFGSMKESRENEPLGAEPLSKVLCQRLDL